MIDVLLFAGFVVSALWAALRCRRSELAARRDIEDLFSSPNTEGQTTRREPRCLSRGVR